MLIQYNTFYRRFGVRLPTQLTTPPVPRAEMLDLPRESIYHYLGVGPTDEGPTDKVNALKSSNRSFTIETILDLSTQLGNPRRVPTDISRVVRNQRVKNPRFRAFQDLASAERDPMSILVCNYCFIPRLYRYQRSYYSNYYAQYNFMSTVWSHMADLAVQSNRNQFVEFDLPEIIPSVGQLRIAEHSINQKLAAMFSFPESLAILEMWKWLGPNRKLSTLSKIPEDRLDRINVIFRESSRWVMVNLGILNKWRQATREELAAEKKEMPAQESFVEQFPFVLSENFNLSEEALNEWYLALEAGAAGEPAVRLQMRFLRMLVTLFEARSLDVPENLGDEDTKVIDDAGSAVKEGDQTGNASVRQTTDSGEPAATQEPVKSEPTDVSDVDKDIDALSGTKLPPTGSTGPAYKSPEVHGKDLDTAMFAKSFSDIEADLAKLDEINHLIVTQNQETTVQIQNPTEITPKTHEEAIKDICVQLAELGALSAAEYRRYTENAGAFKQIDVNGTKLGDLIQIPKELISIDSSVQLPDKETVTDKSMLKSTLLEFDKKYVEQVLQRDIASMVTNLQQAGILVQDYAVEEVEDITGTYLSYAIKVKPLQGASSTLRFRIPKVLPDGTFKVNGVSYRTRKQRGDLPIRKISPSMVKLSSYYGKLSVDRSEKKVDDYGRWLRDSIMAIALDKENDTVTNIVTGKSFSNTFKCPRLYSAIGTGFRSFRLRIDEESGSHFWDLNFDPKLRTELVKTDKLALIESNGDVVVGLCDDGRIMVMADNGRLYWINESIEGQFKLEELPTIEEILGLQLLKAPVDFTELKLLGKHISTGVVLGYLMGLDKLLLRLNVDYRIVPAGERPKLESHEWMIVFQDESWVFSRENALATLVLAGWRDFEVTTRQFNSHEFNRRDVYLNLLEEHDLQVRFVREMDLVNQMFIDPIAKGLLEEMKEPTVFTELLLRACEMLTTDDHPDELDASYMRVKGYERFAGLLYTELVRSVRTHNGRANKTAYPLELNPYAVWIAINQDPAKNQVSEINPIQNLKEQEAVTYSGTGGRIGRSLVKRTRAYHPSDMGVISEATVDSSDVAINTYLSADPMFNSLRGTANKYDIEKSGATSLFSTSALTSVAAENDDPKRVNFISIQHSHGVACEGYHQSPVRTGYEQVIGERTGDMYCVTAKKNGKIISLNEKGIIVEYEDGERIGVELGRRYGAAAGLTIPHSIVTTRKLGDTVAPGDAIAYNSGFFEPDVLNPKQVIWKSSLIVETVLMEAPSTLEDSSEISKEVSDKLRTKTTKVRTIVVNFSQQIHNLVKAGESVEYESILCMIEDSVSAGGGLLSPEQIETLRSLAAQSPTAKARGVVERVEMYYHGDKEDMSSSLLALAEFSDKQISQRNRSVGKRAFTGSVDENFRIENEPLLLDTAAIQIYITSDVSAGVGDKGVFGNQMKSVFGGVFEGNVRTESDRKIGAIFGAKSVDDRIVLSPYVIGTTNTLLDVIGQKAVEAYES